MKTHISDFPRRRAAFEALDKLTEDFVKAHGRKPKADLFYGEYWKPEARYPEVYLVAYHEKDGTEDAKWMKENIF